MTHEDLPSHLPIFINDTSMAGEQEAGKRPLRDEGRWGGASKPGSSFQITSVLWLPIRF